MKEPRLQAIEGRSGGFYALAALLGALVAAGLWAAWQMEHHGHAITGMTNQIVWGLPHVFAVFLIVTASGALNVASVASVFGRKAYKPLAPLSAVLAIACLVGGLAVLVLDLGRPDRLVVAMTRYNFRSIFAWNIYLYTGFLAIAAVYLWLMLERRMNRYSRVAGTVAFLWRLILTTGTGSIFGFLVARQAYDAAIMAPLFIAMSLAFGTALFLLVLIGAFRATGRPLGDHLLHRLKNLLGVFVAVVLYFTAVQHLTNLYAAEHHGVERYILVEGGAVTALFWVGQVLVGGLVPLGLVYHPTLGRQRGAIALAGLAVLLGGLAQIYVIIIGGQSYPLILFPGMEVSSSFFDGVIHTYRPTGVELLLGLSGLGITGLITLLALRVLAILPAALGDEQAPAPAAGATEAVRA
ncbi:NrfD/PsrC family molybdoenzyme membrane anchor subunit [Inmirania thermothiophila]|uniref:Molybdopterin-containing oxidoreductase family membrane subunit n=1 Tax=Inmirania thermothiophila TaxID=1750597 RepID=A0A3N1Y012_9GAMM|nr:NrfD/PsrC family molybdoenzyme membrane anchor subunit [Inmirania thermothiophila]ROR32166.1 molybdopterin-containing oxidoreductase family membrane subunit [Inmirania thermothiophila]